MRVCLCVPVCTGNDRMSENSRIMSVCVCVCLCVCVCMCAVVERERMTQ